jgi:hypothetical protein
MAVSAGQKASSVVFGQCGSGWLLHFAAAHGTKTYTELVRRWRHWRSTGAVRVTLPLIFAVGTALGTLAGSPTPLTSSRQIALLVFRERDFLTDGGISRILRLWL